MTKLKTGLIIGLGLLLLGGGAVASSLLKWGGETDVAGIYTAVDSLDNMLTLKNQDLTKLKAEAGSTKIELDDAKKQHGESLTTIQTVNDELLQKVETLTILQTDLNATKNAVAERDVIIEEKSKKIADYVELLTRYSEQTKTTLAMAQERIDSLEETIGELETDYNTKAAQVKSMSAQIDALRNQKDQLEAENSSLKENNNNTQAQLDAALYDIENLKNYANQKVNEQQAD